MKNLNIAIIDATKKFAKELAKKGGETDFTMYNSKEGGTILVLYEPHTYPDKIQSLLHCIHLADSVLWVIDKIDSDFAEVALALWQTNKPGIIVFDGVDEDQVAPILSKSPMWKWEKIIAPTPADLRMKVMALAEPPRADGKRAVIDACFSVGGVGTVALCKIESGTFKVHDELEFTPAKITAGIRSIQVQDVDVKEAQPGSRAGFALKGITSEQVKRGAYCAEKGAAKVFMQGEAEIELSPLVKDALAPGADVFFSWGMQYTAAKLKLDAPFDSKMGKKKIPFTLANECSAFPMQEFLLVRPDKKPRVIGKGAFAKI